MRFQRHHNTQVKDFSIKLYQSADLAPPQNSQDLNCSSSEKSTISQSVSFNDLLLCKKHCPTSPSLSIRQKKVHTNTTNLPKLHRRCGRIPHSVSPMASTIKTESPSEAPLQRSLKTESSLISEKTESATEANNKKIEKGVTLVDRTHIGGFLIASLVGMSVLLGTFIQTM